MYNNCYGDVGFEIDRSWRVQCYNVSAFWIASAKRSDASEILFKHSTVLARFEIKATDFLTWTSLVKLQRFQFVPESFPPQINRVQLYERYPVPFAQ